MGTQTASVAIASGSAQPASARYAASKANRPVSAALASGLTVGLMALVALSPMLAPPKPKPGPTVFEPIAIPIPPPPPPTPTADPHIPNRTATAAPTPFNPPLAPLVDTIAAVPIDPVPMDPPMPPDLAPVEVEKPLPPPMVEARLDPRHRAAFQPDYPPFERRNEIEGVAKVRVLIGVDGRVKAVEQLSATSPGFFAETRTRALAKWRFKPATRGGVAEESWIVMTVRFEMESA